MESRKEPKIRSKEAKCEENDTHMFRMYKSNKRKRSCYNAPTKLNFIFNKSMNKEKGKQAKEIGM